MKKYSENYIMLPNLMNPDFCCDMQTVGSQLGLNRMNSSTHPTFCQYSRLVVVV